MNRLFLVSTEAITEYKDFLKTKGTVYEMPRDERVYDAISSHSDIFTCVAAGRLFMDRKIADALKNQGHELPEDVILLEGLISIKYPGTVPFNNRQVGKYLFHNLEYMPELIRSHAEKEGLELVHVNQGYTGCSTLVLDEGHLITADKGIHKAAVDRGIRSLLIFPGGIKLERDMEGFIGGAATVLDGQVVFHGRIHAHPDSDRILKFIEEAGLSWQCIGDMPLTDIGGVVQWQAI